MIGNNPILKGEVDSKLQQDIRYDEQHNKMEGIHTN